MRKNYCASVKDSTIMRAMHCLRELFIQRKRKMEAPFSGFKTAKIEMSLNKISTQSAAQW